NPVHGSVVKCIRNQTLDLVAMLESWLVDSKAQHQASVVQFESELHARYQSERKTVLGVSFAPGMIKQLFTKLMRLQTALNKKEIPSHLELLEILEPGLAHR